MHVGGGPANLVTRSAEPSTAGHGVVSVSVMPGGGSGRAPSASAGVVVELSRRGDGLVVVTAGQHHDAHDDDEHTDDDTDDAEQAVASLLALDLLAGGVEPVPVCLLTGVLLGVRSHGAGA